MHMRNRCEKNLSSKREIVIISPIMKALEYQYNPAINFLEIDPKFIPEGVEYAKDNGYNNLRIRVLNSTFDDKYVLDFSPFKDFSDLTGLIIGDDFKIIKTIAISNIEELHNLSYLDLNPSISINVSKLYSLTKLVIKNDQNIIGLNRSARLNSLQIFSTKHNDLTQLVGLNNLMDLTIIGGRIRNLEGIEHCPNITGLKLQYCKYLTNIDIINSTKIQKLYIERCSKIKDLSCLEGNCNLNDVFIDNVESIRFVPSLFNLEKFRFWNCIDGDLKPLLSNNHLIYIYFYPNKRHYTHSLNEILDAKNSI